jgi:hypothetical protein
MLILIAICGLIADSNAADTILAIDAVGDREKPGAERAAKLILVYDVPLQNPVTMASLHGHRN